MRLGNDARGRRVWMIDCAIDCELDDQSVRLKSVDRDRVWLCRGHERLSKERRLFKGFPIIFI